MTLTDALLLAGVGIAGGGVNSIAGGGSLVVFPTLIAVGYAPVAANVTNSLAQWPGYVGGMAGFRNQLSNQWQQAARLSIAAGLGSVVGCVLLLSAPARSFEIVVPFLVLAASLLLALQPLLTRWFSVPHPSRAHLFRLPLIFIAGVYGGYFGGALGVILIALLALTSTDALTRIMALKTPLSAIVSTVTVVIFGIFGPVNWAGVAIIAPATLFGGFFGARLATRLNELILRACVAVFGVAAAIYLFLTI